VVHGCVVCLKASVTVDSSLNAYSGGTRSNTCFFRVAGAGGVTAVFGTVFGGGVGTTITFSEMSSAVDAGLWCGSRSFGWRLWKRLRFGLFQGLLGLSLHDLLIFTSEPFGRGTQTDAENDQCNESEFEAPPFSADLGCSEADCPDWANSCS